jgi:hypothetical protein
MPEGVHEARVVLIGELPLNPVRGSEPSAGIRPWLGCPASRAGMAPITCSAIPSGIRQHQVLRRGDTSRPASSASATVCARISAIAAVIEVSAPDSAVQDSAATCPPA